MIVRAEKTRKSSATPARQDEWTRLASDVANSAEGPERTRAFLRLAAMATRDVPELARHRDSLLALMRSAVAGEALVEELAGEPRALTDEVELPGFTPSDLLAEAGLRGQVRARVLDEELMTASAVAALVGSKSKNARQYANRLRLSSRLLAVPHRNQYLYPAFQLDLERGRVRPVVERVNGVLCAAEDPWGVASWWLSPNGRLDGVSPASLLGDVDAEGRLVDAATALAEDDAA
jgi:hypothetical protein